MLMKLTPRKRGFYDMKNFVLLEYSWNVVIVNKWDDFTLVRSWKY